MQRAGVYERRYDESTQQTATSTCPECDGRVTMSSAETVCADCGLVLAEQAVDPGPEWRTFEDRENRSRTGAPRTPARHDRGLTTEIGQGTDGNGNELSTSKRRQLGRLRRQHARTQRRTTAERNEMLGLTEIRRLCGALGFDDGFRDRACRLFSSAQAADLLRGRSVEAIAAASVYAACRCEGRPQMVADVAQVAQVSASTLRNGYGVLNRELALPATPIAPERFLPRFTSALGLSPAVERRARAVLDAEATPETSGANPAGVAAGAILVAAREKHEAMQFTQAELAEVADLCVVTVRRKRDVLLD